MLVYRNIPADAQTLVDAWVAHAGVPFAVRAVSVANRICQTGELWSRAPEGETYEKGWRGDDLGAAYAVARAVRRHLAVASGQDYAAAEAVLSEYRTVPAERILTSYLMPTRQDWVDEDCAAAASWHAESGREEYAYADHRAMAGILLLAASRPEHLGQLRGVITRWFLGHQDVGVAVTALDGVGPAAVTYLAGEFYLTLLYLADGWNRPGRLNPDAARFVAGTPSDDAMRILIRDHLDEKPSRPGNLLKSGVLTRYPLRVLRVLGERDDPVSRDLFGAMVLTEPRWIPHLPEAVRGRAEQIVAGGGAGLGAGWAAMLDADDWRNPVDGSDNVKRAIGALAAIPADDAFGLVVDRVERKYFRPALLTAAKRDPDLALRVLAARATESAEPVVVELLRDHVLAYPASLSALDESGRARIAAIVEVPVAGAAGQVPPILAGASPREPGLPAWLIPAKLPGVTVRDSGETLAPEAVRRLCVLLALSTITEPVPELAVVRDICPRRELSAFAWAILEQWRAAEYPPKSGLALTALATLGDDTTVPALVAALPGWASASARIRAGMDVLAAIGTDIALTALHRLPRPGAADDPALARTAQERFTELKKEARRIGGDRIRAVEDAMVTGRRWTAGEFRALFVEHPLMWQLTHRLLWAAFGAHEPVFFRAAEDRTLADLDDKPWTLDDGAVVGVPHPWHLGADRAAWAEVFADYAVIQPFPQLGRELTTPAEVDLASFAGAPVDGRRLFVLTSKGWRFGDDHTSVLRDWPEPVEICYSPGYHWQEPDAPKNLTGVRGCADLSPIAFSEVIRDLHYLTDDGVK